MRVPLPQIRTNGHAPPPGRVYVISGLCQQPLFRISFQTDREQDFCLISMGTPGGAEVTGADGDPFFLLRRCFDGGAVVVAARVDWEGIFTVLANDDERAEAVFTELIAPGLPEDTSRQWSEDASTMMMFAELLHLA